MDSPDALSIALRIVSFVLLLNAVGVAIFRAVFGQILSVTKPVILRLGWRLAIAAMIAVAAHQGLEAARMAGEMGGMFDPAMQRLALESSTGAAFAFRMLGLALVAAGLLLASRSSGAPTAASRSGAEAISLTGATLAIVSFILTGHTSVAPHRPAAALFLAAHLIIVAFWIGSLLPLYLSASREHPQVAARVIDAFSRVAFWAVPGIALAGIGLAVILIPGLAALRQPYGILLLTKAVLFAVLLSLATLNKYLLGPACAEGNTLAFRWTVAIEYLLVCTVLAVTAVMTAFYSPEGP